MIPYDVRAKIAAEVLALHGLAKFAAAPGFLNDLGRGAKWLFSSHPNMNTYQAKPGLMGRWLGGQDPNELVTHFGRGPGLWNKMKDVGHFVGETARGMYLGSPVDLHRELTQHAQNQGGLGKGLLQHAKHYYWHPEAGLGNLLGLGFTGYEAYNALTGDKSNRIGDIAGLGASVALAPLTGYLGMPGALLHVGATNAAKAIGHKFDTPAPESPPIQYTPHDDQKGHLMRYVRATTTPPVASVEPARYYGRVPMVNEANRLLTPGDGG